MAQILIAATGEILSDHAEIARTRRERARGLLGRPPLQGTASLVFPKTRQIHTFGMAYPLDVVFCDRKLEVIQVTRNLPPGRISRWVRKSSFAIEMRAGSVPATVTSGSRLVLLRSETG